MPESTISTIEHDIIELERRLEEKKSSLEQEKSGTGGAQSGTHRSEKELLHEVVGEKIKEHIPSFQPSLPSSAAPIPAATEPPSYLSQELKDKIQEIIRLVFDKNLEEGIKEAGRSGNPAVIDAFHDILTDELYSQLVEKGKLKKIE